MENKLVEELKNQTIFRMDESSRMIKISLDQLSESDIWRKPNGSSNSIGNILVHLCGNITQYAIASLGETEDTRDRDKEFSIVSGGTKEELWQQLFQTVQKAKDTIQGLPIEKLMLSREVQGYTFTGMGIIIHVVEHYSYHTGQIAFWTKIIKDKQLGFYYGIDLTVKNKES